MLYDVEIFESGKILLTWLIKVWCALLIRKSHLGYMESKQSVDSKTEIRFFGHIELDEIRLPNVSYLICV